MDNRLISGHQLLIYYLQTLNNAETQQIKYFSKWVQHSYSKYFRNFLTDQGRHAHDHHASLKSLEGILGIHLSGEVCEPVQGLLREIEKVTQFSKKNADLTEPVVAQLLQCVKYYELVTCQAALVLARSLEEARIISVLTEIVQAKDQAYFQLQNLVKGRRQNERAMADVEVEEE